MKSGEWRVLSGFYRPIVSRSTDWFPPPRRLKGKAGEDYMRFRLYHGSYDSISYDRKEGRIHYFNAYRLEPDYRTVREYAIDASQPDSLWSTDNFRVLYQDSSRQFQTGFPPYRRQVHPFPDFAAKRAFMLDALMRNIYAYRLNRLGNLDSVLHPSGELDTETLYALLPNYDEYLANMDILRVPKSWLDTRYRQTRGEGIFIPLEAQSKDYFDQYVGGEKQKGYWTDWIGTRYYAPDIEFYKVYRMRPDILVRKDTTTTGERWPTVPKHYRLDEYWNPDAQLDSLRADTLLRITPKWLALSYGLNRRHPERNEDPLVRQFGAEVDFYVLALDTRLRRVYFVSGPEIFLNKDIDELYYSWNSSGAQRNVKPFREWDRRLQLAYLTDRLYQYRLFWPLTEEHIIAEDEAGFRVRATTADGQTLEAGVQYADPDELHIRLVPPDE